MLGVDVGLVKPHGISNNLRLPLATSWAEWKRLATDCLMTHAHWHPPNGAGGISNDSCESRRIEDIDDICQTDMSVS